MSYYRYHVFGCQNERPEGHPRGCCKSRGGVDLVAHIKARIKQEGLQKDIRINKAGCLDRCEDGPVLVVYPEEVWYHLDNLGDADRIVDEHLLGGRPVEDLRLSSHRDDA